MNPGPTSEGIIQRMTDFENGKGDNPTRLVYDDSHYWILKPNKSIMANMNGMAMLLSCHFFNSK